MTRTTSSLPLYIPSLPGSLSSLSHHPEEMDPHAAAALHVIRALSVFGQAVDHAAADRKAVEDLRGVLTGCLVPQLGRPLRERDPDLVRQLDDARIQAAAAAAGVGPGRPGPGRGPAA